MDVNTGEIKQFRDEEELADATNVGVWEELKGLAKPSCRKCYGTGLLGRNVLTGTFLACSCVKKKPAK